MVKVAIAGGSGQVAREVINALVATRKHEIVVFSRSQCPENTSFPGTIEWAHVDYNSQANLVEALQGVHTLLSFIQLLSDPAQLAQKNLIDAAVIAKVKRFAPSEYGSKGTSDMPGWQGKENIREYLREINAKETVLEYTLFQPGIFLDYLAYPHQTARHLTPLQTVFDLEHRRAMVVAGYEERAVMTLTTVADLAAIVARAVDCDDSQRWPLVGGIRGNRLTMKEIVDICRRVRSPEFEVTSLQIADLEAGHLKAPWGLAAVHHAVDADAAVAMLRQVAIGLLLTSAKGDWDSSDEMNELFPDHEFTKAEEFLANVWTARP